MALRLYKVIIFEIQFKTKSARWARPIGISMRSSHLRICVGHFVNLIRVTYIDFHISTTAFLLCRIQNLTKQFCMNMHGSSNGISQHIRLVYQKRDQFLFSFPKLRWEVNLLLAMPEKTRKIQNSSLRVLHSRCF